MKELSFSILISIVLLLASCNHRKDVKVTSSSEKALVPVEITNDTLITFDTTIILSDIPTSKNKSINLTDTLAKQILYAHFKKKGYYTSENLPDLDRLTKRERTKLSVDYTSIFIADFNNNSQNDAVITYWLTPPYANGHCWQPHKAIIVDTDNGYKITNEDFIPTNFAIDSIKKVNDQLTLFGYDYDCANEKTLKRLKIRLTK